MLSDPQSITIRTEATTLPRIVSSVDGQTVYADNSGKFAVQIAHQKSKGKNNRHTVKLTEVRDVAQPDGSFKERLASAHIVLTEPAEGFTPSEVRELGEALTAYLDATLMDRVLGFES